MTAECRTFEAVVVGTGAAGYNAALRLFREGLTDVAIVTEGVNTGTSRNTGSDKQTYYKMNLCADMPDSPAAMAKDLFAGKCVDGDIAYAEAANSVRSFLNLVELGVPFPTNSLGEYVGYKTDHDPCARATSVGPLTSKMMTEKLEQAVLRAGIPVMDGLLVVSVLRDENGVVGLLALDEDAADSPENRFVLIQSSQVIWCTGGPAGMYADSVYPACHTGSSGVAFEAGIPGKNLTEWQYGLASVNPRWNVSGTYMQVLPRFVSVDENGTEHEFLSEYYGDMGKTLSAVFKKGYQWPFDSRKALDGSSVIDLLVYRETALRGRRVYLDFRNNPGCVDALDFTMDEEGYRYLASAGALFGTPLERLLHMNAPAYDLYLSKGLDLKTEMLEIALCAQHNNGGLDVDMWWQTAIPGFFAAGEVAGTHGVYRPGGSALNSGQVGSLRAALYAASHRRPLAAKDAFADAASPALKMHTDLMQAVSGKPDNAAALLEQARIRMSHAGGAIRNTAAIKDALRQTKTLLDDFSSAVGASTKAGVLIAYKLRDTLLCQRMYLSAMLAYVDMGGLSRGSALYSDKNGRAAMNLEDVFRFIPDTGKWDDNVMLMTLENNEITSSVRPVRPLPAGGGFFENVWRSYRQNGNIDYQTETK